MADTLVDLERKFYIQQLGLTAAQASVLNVQDLDAHVEAAAIYPTPHATNYKANADQTENIPRSYAGALGGVSLTSGRIVLQSMYLIAGMPVTSIVHINGSVLAVGQTNLWASLWSPSLNRVALSQDETTNIVPTTTEKAFTIVGGPYIVPATGMYYTGMCFVGTTAPSSLSCVGNVVSNAMVPCPVCLATVTGLTNPASAPSSVVLGPASASIPYMQVR